MARATDTRTHILRALEENVHGVKWLAGRLAPTMAHPTITYGAISSIDETTSVNTAQDQRRILIQVWLPCAVSTNPTAVKIADPAVIEDLAERVRAVLLGEQAGVSPAYGFLRHTTTRYPSDLNDQQTRFEMEVAVWDISDWG